MPANKYSDSLLMDALRGSLSNAESFGRGFGVAPVGLLGDVNALAREYITPRLPANVQGLLQSMPSAPTTESILSAIPRMTAPRMESSGMEQIGAAANPRGPINLGRAVASLPSDVAKAGQEFLAAGQPARVVPPNVVRQMDMPVNLPTSQEFLNAVTQEPSAAITPEGLLMNVKRQQTPKQSGLESVRSGVFYLPEGQAANLKHYKGKTAYGGTEPIEGQTLYKNPLFIKGATGGKAPENAYDSLLGKGAYEQMRSDALRVRHPDLIKDPRYNLSDALTPEQFLSKYAPDLEGMGDYIFSNSRQGNQLAYALQEAAVAQKVRDAGHDAVIGYSKGRGNKGEFFSEVFDVREKNYPTPQGDYELMPQFEGLIK